MIEDDQQDVNPEPRVDPGRRQFRRWRRQTSWVRSRFRSRKRMAIAALAVAVIVLLPSLVLVAGLRAARAATGGVASAPGTLYDWGLNGDGELGTATTETCSGYMCSSAPVALSALPNVKATAGGDEHTLAVTADGSMYAWGSNYAGQLGVTTQQTCYGQPCSPVPVQVTGLPAVAAVAAGQDQSLALTTGGAVYAWGGNDSGDLGIGNNTTSAPTPTLVTGLPTNVIAVAADAQDSLALTADGLVYAWGDDSYGQVGVTATTTCGATPCVLSPTQVPGLSGVMAIAAGVQFNLALTSSGTVYAWGDNTYGTLGNGSTTSSTTPQPVAQIANVTAIAAGGSALAVTSSGSVYAWGDDSFGQVGASTTQTCGNGYACSTTPLYVNGLPTPITEVAAGGQFSLALASDGTVWSWGVNSIGELGIGSSDANAHATPAQVVGLTGVGAIGAGSHVGLAIVPPANGPTPTATPTQAPAPVAVLSTTYINFGDQQLSTTSAASPITLSNTGTATLTVTGAALSGANPGDFILAGGTCVSASGGTTVQIAPGGSCTMTVSFQPTAIGTRSGTLMVSCNAVNCPLTGSVTGNGINPIESVSPTSISFPDTYLGSTSSAPVLLSVGNNGTSDLIVSGITLGGANPGDFQLAVSQTVPVSVSPGQSLTITAYFTPTAVGARSATLSFTTNDSLRSQTATLSGNGIQPADLGVTLSGSPNPVKSGTHLTYTITVQNAGPGVANGISLSDTLPAGETFYSAATTSGTCSAPAVGGTGTVTCTLNSLPNGGSFTVTLVVTVTARGGTTVSDTASVSATTQDPNTANNSASVTTSVSKH